MNLVDVIILLSLAMGAIIGFKRGFFKQTVIFVGTILVFILAFALKDPVSVFLYENFPFLNFKGLSSLNILLYQGIAFILVLTILTMLLKVVIAITGLFETLLKVTIILAIPSKILGAVVGVFHAYIIIYIILFIIASPILNIKIVNESKLKDSILEKTPILSSITSKLVTIFDDVIEIKNTPIKNSNDRLVLDKKLFDIIINSGITASEKLYDLASKGKLNVYTNEKK